MLYFCLVYALSIFTFMSTLDFKACSVSSVNSFFYFLIILISHVCDRDESLKAHIKFLESQGIAGVSHHSLLFSKAAAPVHTQDDEEVIR